MGMESLAPTATAAEFLVASVGFPPSTMLVDRASAEEVAAPELAREAARERSGLLPVTPAVSVLELSWTSTCDGRQRRKGLMGW